MLLTTLDLGSNQIGIDGARALADSEHLGSLRSLKLHANRLDDQSVRALRESPQLSGVTIVVGRQLLEQAG